MKWWIVVAIVIAVAPGADAVEAGEPHPVDLQLRNEAPVPAHVLEQSQAEVARIFADAGLAVRWTDTGPRFTVTIVPQVLGYASALSPVMGVALRSTNRTTAQVFFRQVQDFAYAYRVDLGTILAHVIAHELGHLLLLTNAHSPTGLMRPMWDEALVRDIKRGSVTFTEAQAARIRSKTHGN
jgi:hypothetical protein